ncbi:MAG TPA: DUF6647 family protein, partial [Usitatibacter sp.]|nr:DUF6647 family protein [Usitatibacter sp.]
QTIYLPANWSPKSQRDVSVLVHELVHHVQNVGEVHGYACAAEKERDAYAAQQAWLAKSRRNLLREFKIDAMTLFARTVCLY